MSLRVCIPTAGTGSRLGDLTRYLNKSLVGIANRPTLSHLIEQFPEDTEFVIALGHKGRLVREFIELAYPNGIYSFVEVFPYEGPGSGLGWSLLQCRKHLQQPFIFVSCDTLIRGSLPPLENNWMGYAEREDVNAYRTLEVDGDSVIAICEKGEGTTSTHKPYIGLAGIVDFQPFWSAMEDGKVAAIARGEAYGLANLIERGITAHRFTWFDVGNPTELARTRKALQEPDSPNILEKPNEAIWFVDGQVIKFSDDQDFIANRVQRADEIKGFVPRVSGVKHNMYKYPKAPGRVLSEVVSLPLFENLLKHGRTFWVTRPLEKSEQAGFRDRCLKFYKKKTLERIQLFYRTFERQDGTEKINGVSMPTLSELLETQDWGGISDGLAGRFHGDFHFENILWDEQGGVFTFLDWRQDFGGSLKIGDIYYDLAKLLHGLIINHELIAENHYRIEWREDEIRFDFLRKQILVDCENRFYPWLHENGYDAKKVKTLTALVFLNIAALHHDPYSLLLYALGKSMLHALTQE